MTQFNFKEHIDIDNFRDVSIDPADDDDFWVVYSDGGVSRHSSEADACRIQRAWRLAHGRHPLTAKPLVDLLRLAAGLAEEAVGVREDEDDPMAADHRETLVKIDALIEALKDH